MREIQRRAAKIPFCREQFRDLSSSSKALEKGGHQVGSSRTDEMLRKARLALVVFHVVREVASSPQHSAGFGVKLRVASLPVSGLPQAGADVAGQLKFAHSTIVRTGVEGCDMIRHRCGEIHFCSSTEGTSQ